jgi:hypothetical protein
VHWAAKLSTETNNPEVTGYFVFTMIFLTETSNTTCLQKMILVLGSSSKSGNAAPSAPTLQDEMSWALNPPGAQPYHHESVQFIEEMIKKLEKPRDALKIKGSKKSLLDSALNQLKAYNNLDTLSQSPWYWA